VPGGTTSRKLEVFVLHAVNDNRAVNYRELFDFIASIPARERSIERGEKLVAIPELTVSSSRVSFVAYEGPLGTNPLIFDSSEARARIERLSSGEVLATRTHGVIDLRQREAVVEFNHRGAKAHEVASVFEELGRRNPNWKALALELNPLPTAEFLAEIQKFRRVRLASIRVARPNPAWNRSYEILKDVAEESSGQTIDLAVTAGRGQSLSTRGGIIRWIRELVSERLPPLKNATIVGTREGEDDETVVSLARYHQHQRVRVRLTSDGHVDGQDIQEKIRGYLDQRTHRSTS